MMGIHMSIHRPFASSFQLPRWIKEMERRKTADWQNRRISQLRNSRNQEENRSNCAKKRGKGVEVVSPLLPFPGVFLCVCMDSVDSRASSRFSKV